MTSGMASGRGDSLAQLGAEIAKMKFSYRIRYTTKPEYWEGKISEYGAYFEKSQSYYEQAYSLIKGASPEQAGMFLLMLSKFHRLRSDCMGALRRVRQNPTVMNAKDAQQSRWSKDAREQIFQCSNRCLMQEKAMSSFFREFCNTRLQDT